MQKSQPEIMENVCDRMETCSAFQMLTGGTVLRSEMIRFETHGEKMLTISRFDLTMSTRELSPVVMPRASLFLPI